FAERFENVAKATVDAIWDWDIENNTIWWNHGISTLFGYDRDEVMREPAAWSRYVVEEDRERVLKTIVDTVNSDDTFMNLAYRFHRADGSVAHIEEHSFVMRNKEGKAIRMVGGMTDVTAGKLMAEQLSHAQRLQTVGELTGGVAHDFNNLLTVIQGNNELLSEALAQDPRLMPLTSMISQASERAAGLVQRLLAFARKQPLDPHPTDVALLIKNVHPLIRRAVPERIAIKLDVVPDLPDVMIDPSQLESALLNLCLNARDAMSGQGKLLIETNACQLDTDYCDSNPGAEPGDYVVISVTDTGSGMTADVKQRAFDPFFTTKNAGQGSGLGLSMVYGFIKQSGGHIAVDSEPDAGTVIRMYLPVANSNDVTLETNCRVAPTKHAEPARHSLSVLLVEDDELVRRYAEKQFRELGYRVISASNGAEALSLLNTHKPVDLLFTDVMMDGGMNGPELAKAALEIQPALPVLFTSGYSENAISHQGRLQAGIQLLSKPWRRDDLARKLEGLMSTLQ
ncbi:MAG: response regulator, partial [Gammaproteobacteria bacterium]|nr:response regulator [Gammaproteobacteria bacterium]